MPIVDTPGSWSFSVFAGADFSRTLTLGTAYNLTGYDARMQMREAYTSGSAVLTLGTGTGITLGGTAGTILIEISDTQTAALGSAFSNATTQLVYDLELESGGGEVTRLVQGICTLHPEVTR